MSQVSGYNTDCPRCGVDVHVQTEHKPPPEEGQGAIVETLVFVGGHVLGFDRIQVDAAESSEEVRELIRREHRAMVEQVQLGAFDPQIQHASACAERARRGAGAPPLPPGPEVEEPPGAEIEEALLGAIVGWVQKVRLVLELSERPCRDGVVAVRARSSRDGSPVEGAEICVKTGLSSSSSQKIGRGRTDAEGLAAISLDLPMGSGDALDVAIFAASGLGTGILRTRIRLE